MPPYASHLRVPMTRIVLVEPYALVRASLTEIIGAEPDLKVVGALSDIGAAIAVVRDEPVDVVVIDTELPIVSLVPAVHGLRRECPTAAVVLLGHRRDDEELFRAIEAGAAAHVLDTVRPDALTEVIRAVAAGEYVIDRSVAARPHVARRILETFRQAALQREPEKGPAGALEATLSKRELQVLTAISQGQSTKDIARTLSISTFTVNNHVKSALRKLAVNNRTRAVLVALRNSWIPVPDPGTFGQSAVTRPSRPAPCQCPSATRVWRARISWTSPSVQWDSPVRMSPRKASEAASSGGTGRLTWRGRADSIERAPVLARRGRASIVAISCIVISLLAVVPNRRSREPRHT
jgi:DNA-binding NarL/FixJ family response regulator